MDKKIYRLERGKFTYPLTKQLILDGRKNKVLNNKINFKNTYRSISRNRRRIGTFEFFKKNFKNL